MLSIKHKGVRLNQQQLDAIVPVVNENMQKGWPLKKFQEKIDEALAAAGCPVEDNNDGETVRQPTDHR